MRPASAIPTTLSEFERCGNRLLREGDGFPPCDVLVTGAGRLCVTLAVAGFGIDDLSVAVAGDQLIVRGRRPADAAPREYLHRGIAMRRFQRTFLLGGGLQVAAARLENGLLNIEFERTGQPVGRSIPIASAGSGPQVPAAGESGLMAATSATPSRDPVEGDSDG